jgi:hypothetical protein
MYTTTHHTTITIHKLYTLPNTTPHYTSHHCHHTQTLHSSNTTSYYALHYVTPTQTLHSIYHTPLYMLHTPTPILTERTRQYGHRKHQTKASPSFTNKETESFENSNSSSPSSSPPTISTNSLQPFTPSKTKFSSQSSPQNRS